MCAFARDWARSTRSTLGLAPPERCLPCTRTVTTMFSCRWPSSFLVLFPLLCLPLFPNPHTNAIHRRSPSADTSVMRLMPPGCGGEIHQDLLAPVFPSPTPRKGRTQQHEQHRPCIARAQSGRWAPGRSCRASLFRGSAEAGAGNLHTSWALALRSLPHTVAQRQCVVGVSLFLI